MLEGKFEYRAAESSDSLARRETIGAAKAVLKAGMMMCVQASCITADDIAWLDSQGIETILSDQILDGSITLGQALGAALVSDRPDGLIPTVVVDEDMVSLGLCYSKRESLDEAVKRKVGVYWRCVAKLGIIHAKGLLQPKFSTPTLYS